MNKSGWVPTEYKVMVMPIEIEEKTEGGIILPQNTQDDEFLAQADGVLVDMTDMSFSDWQCQKPNIGDTVKYAKYSGRMIKGDDEKDYRIMNDKDIIAFRRKQ